MPQSRLWQGRLARLYNDDVYYEDVAVPDVVEVCKTDVAYNCDKQGPVECETLYDNVCETTRTVHTVEDDVATCSLVQETDQSCVDYNNGNLIIHSRKGTLKSYF